MGSYDEQILLKGAKKLLSEAGRIVFLTAFIFGLIAFFAAIIGFGVLSYETRNHEIPIVGFSSGVAIVGAGIGIWEGRRRAFDLLLRSHQLLVLVQIERNTRKFTV